LRKGTLRAPFGYCVQGRQFARPIMTDGCRKGLFPTGQTLALPPNGANNTTPAPGGSGGADAAGSACRIGVPVLLGVLPTADAAAPLPVSLASGVWSTCRTGVCSHKHSWMQH